MEDGIEATSITRESGEFAGSLYMCAALSAAFLRTFQGQALLRAADYAGRGLLHKAQNAHKASTVGGLECYSWDQIRALHAKGPV